MFNTNKFQRQNTTSKSLGLNCEQRTVVFNRNRLINNENNDTNMFKERLEKQLK